MSKFKIILLTSVVMSLTACGQAVEVPPAHKGKVLTRNGYSPEIIPPSRFRLPFCMFYCDKLTLVEVSDIGMTETFKLFMPKDQLNMSFDIRFTMSINSDEKSLSSVFAKMSPTTISGGAHYKVHANSIYVTYGQPIIRERIRSVVAKYTINEVASSRETINKEVYEAVNKSLIGVPISVKRLAFADLQFPDIIVKAKEAAAERNISIEKEKADKKIALIRLETDFEKAKKERAVRRERAEAAREENKIFSESVTDKYLKYKTLEVLEKMAENQNAVFVPVEALGTIGLSQKVFK